MIYILADGGPSVGGGHISRCRSIAYEMDGMGQPVRWIVPVEASPFMRKEEDFSGIVDFTVEAISTVLNADNPIQKSDILLVDGYRFSEELLRFLGDNCILVVLDDYRNIPVDRWASIVINYNLGVTDIPYGREAVKLLGPSYCPLRPSFAKLTPSDDGFVLFLAGASDVAGVTVDVVTWYDTSWPPMVAVLGPMVPDDYFDKVSRMADNKDGLTLMRAPSDFDGLMARASSVVCTSSVTCYEAMALGKPVVAFQVAENQRRIGRALSELGWGIDLGWWKDVSPEILHSAIEKAFPPPAGCVPTDGAKRVASAILSMVR